ncbi:DNA mismatch repair protein MutL [Cristinia sonorae]|uniref:DNA mismatch repair protein MutL n=1 Tax=Cristinia sonorae TaxID=1940300 RepID=A0A8K0XKP9_9AGAR|nr:DNA mismatch repair protein MutL [Cristinia sonorae]
MADTDASPSEPLPIRRLQESVINRIAAGEIIHRPASALKELIENSLDAHSTSIRVTIKDGGMRLLQIQDDGCGIRKSDLPILAERFTTSKISTFSDLSKLTTYGFRGEALASISYVAEMTVTTKTKADSCAWKACYSDGALVPFKQGATAEPKATAGTDGTTITVENLFYNTPTRLSALRGSAEEYARILDVVTKYAVHNPHVAFTCRKANSNSPDVTTPSGSTVTQAIRQLYGQTIAKDLVHSVISSPNESGESDDDPTWSAEAYYTNANYHAKKTVFLLFINHRLVESTQIKKALETVYTGILPKGTSPFIYLSLQLDPRTVDVNVHPTKREVHFLDEDAIIESICDKIQQSLVAQSQSRSFEYQTLLTGGIARNNKGKGKERLLPAEEHEDTDSGSSTSVSTPATKKVPSNHKIRTSQKDRTLDSMFPVLNTSQMPNELVPDLGSQDEGTSRKTTKSRTDIPMSECYLMSVRQLREAIEAARHQQFTEILQNHIFVGIVDVSRCLSLVQNFKKLYLVNHGALAEELFYQLGLRQFGNLRRIKLDPPPPIKTLISLAVDVEEGIKKTKLNKALIIDRIVEILMEHRAMLSEYFSMNITEEGRLESIPLLLPDYTPNLDKLPLFLMRLGPQVEWTSEKGCFSTFFRELAYFYVPEPLIPENSLVEGSPTADTNEKALAWQIQHVLFPTFARYLIAPKTLLDRDVVEVANLPDLYRVFERC